MGEIRFYSDPETDQPHIYNHGVTEREVEEILKNPIRDDPTAIIRELLLAKHMLAGISK